MYTIFKQKRGVYDRNGFSFIELIIAIAIISILASVAFVNFSGSQKREKLKAAQQEVASAIMLARSYALQGVQQYNSVSNAMETPCGYGFSFTDPNTYTIFYNFSDISGCGSCKEANGDENCRIYFSDSGRIDFKLSNDAKLDFSGDLRTLTEIYFTVPNGDMYSTQGINPNYVGNPQTSQMVLKLKIGNDATQTKSVRVNSGAKITTN